MSDPDNWLGPNELDQISKICSAFTTLYETLAATGDVSIDDEFWSNAPTLYDCNGDPIGCVGFAENGGFAFFPWLNKS